MACTHLICGADAMAGAVLAAGGAVAISVGNYFGGCLVYQQGMRVSVEI